MILLGGKANKIMFREPKVYLSPVTFFNWGLLPAEIHANSFTLWPLDVRANHQQNMDYLANTRRNPEGKDSIKLFKNCKEQQ